MFRIKTTKLDVDMKPLHYSQYGNIFYSVDVIRIHNLFSVFKSMDLLT